MHSSKKYLLFAAWTIAVGFAAIYRGGLHTAMLLNVWITFVVIGTIAGPTSWTSLFATHQLIGTANRSHCESRLANASIVLFFIGLGCGVVASPMPGVASEQAMALALLPSAYLLARATNSAGLSWERLWTAVKAVGFILAVFAVCERVLTGQRAYTVLADPNALAALFNALLIVSASQLLGLIADFRRRHEILPHAGITLLFAAGEGSTGSLSGLICLAIALLGLLAPFAKKVARKRLPIAVATIAALIMVISSFSLTGRAETPISKLGELSSHSSFTVRLEMIKSSWAIYQDHHWYGSGLASYKLYYPLHRSPLDSNTSGDLAHNDYVQFLQEGGPTLLGALLLWVFLSAVATLRLFRQLPGEKFYKYGIGLALIALLVHAAMNFIFYVAPLAIIFGVLLAGLADQTPFKKSLPADGRKSPLHPIFVAVCVIGLLATLGARSLMLAITNDNCSVQACRSLQANGSFKKGLVSFLASSQPTWLPVREYLFSNASRAADAADNPAEQKAWRETALREAISLQHDIPALPNGYLWIADLIVGSPELSARLPSGLPHDPIDLYQLALDRDPYNLGTYINMSKVLQARNDAAGEYALIVGKAMPFWNYYAWGDSGRMTLLIAAIPPTVILRRCDEAKAMSEGLKVFIDLVIDLQRNHIPLPMPSQAPVLPDAGMARIVREQGLLCR